MQIFHNSIAVVSLENLYPGGIWTRVSVNEVDVTGALGVGSEEFYLFMGLT
jgi:hypothetical protein